MIEYIPSTGCAIIGTHKRVKSFPFTFGEQKPHSDDSREYVSENGAKMLYWATQRSTTSAKSYRALVYRSGKGHVATILTTAPELSMGTLVYRKKHGAKFPTFSQRIRDHLYENVCELSFGQGGSEWHFLRARLGLVTSTIASLFFRLLVHA